MTGHATFGYSALPPRVASALATVYGHHRTPWFEGLLEEIAAFLSPAFGSRYTPLFMTCTGAGSREAVVANLVRASDYVLTTGPAFERLVRTWGAQVQRVSSGTDVGPKFPDAVLVEHVLADGSLVDLTGIASGVRSIAPSVPIVLDASISFGSDVWRLQDYDADAVIVVPERALMGVPGLTIVGVSERFLETVAARRPQLSEPPFLYDLQRYHRAWSKRTTPYSPNISACVALHAALGLIESCGGLQQHVDYQRGLADTIRAQLIAYGISHVGGKLQHTHAFSSCAVASGLDRRSALDVFDSLGIAARAVAGKEFGLQVAHAGYVTNEQLEALRRALDEVTKSHHAATAAAFTTAGYAQDLRPESPFTIAAREFAAQAEHHAKNSFAHARTRERVVDAAKRVFRDAHVVHEEALRHRRVGFVGAGRIARRTVELCLARGITRISVYSPSLARARAGEALSEEQRRRVTEWQDLTIHVALSPDELFTTSQVVVLLPVVYDEQALALFRMGPEYRNHELVNSQLLARAKDAGRLDLLINAAARAALVNRHALTRAVDNGWLRYYSDELPAADDPLLASDDVRFTGHVGGSCQAPQAAVARNTHEILKYAIGQLGGLSADSAASDRPLSLVNGHLLGPESHGRGASVGASSNAAGSIRVLLTDPFDVESLAFDRIRELGGQIEVHDVSRERLSSDDLVGTIRRIRPHILMLRSRTVVDDVVAAAIAPVTELAFIIRPGVGVDNLHDGMQRLSAARIQIINEPYGNSFAVAEMALHFILSGTETTLLAPGPTKFNPRVFEVASDYAPTRVRLIAALDVAVGQSIGEWLGARDAALTLSGPGTAMMEAAIANLTLPGAHGLVISHGKFGDRFAEIAEARRRRCEVLRVAEPEWGAAITPEHLERALQQDAERHHDRAPLSFLCFQQNETSSGVTYHQDAIRRLVSVARAYNPEIVIIADAISGAFAHRLEFDALDLDMLLMGSQKALGVSSGLAFCVLSSRARNAMAARAGWIGTFDALCQQSDLDRYLDEFDRRQHVRSISLLRALVARRRGQLVDEPSIFHLLSTETALDLLGREGGIDAVLARHARLAQVAREGMARAGLRTMAKPPFESDSVTVGILPAGVSASSIRKAMARETAIEIAGSQGDYWKPSMIRIGTLGFVSHSDVIRCVRALGAALAEAGHVVEGAVPAEIPIRATPAGA